MKKILGVVLGLVVILIAVLLIGKNIIAKTVVTGGVKAVTGLELEIGKMDVGLANTLIGIDNMILYNPSDFTDRVMVDMPEIFVDYDLAAFFKGKVHLEEVRINLKELTVIKNKDGVLNLDSLKAAKSGEEAEKAEEEAEKGEKPEISIDLLKLKIGKVSYKDYSKGDKPKVLEYNVNIDEEYENITDIDKLAKIILVNALINTNIAKLTNFDLGSLTAVVPDSVKKLGEMGAETLQKGSDIATDTFEGLGEGLKKLNPFGK